MNGSLLLFHSWSTAEGAHSVTRRTVVRCFLCYPRLRSYRIRAVVGNVTIHDFEITPRGDRNHLPVWAVPALGPLERGNFADALAMLIHHPIRRLATSLALAVLALLGLACAWAQVAGADTGGALDASFSADGRVATDLFGGGSELR